MIDRSLRQAQNTWYRHTRRVPFLFHIPSARYHLPRNTTRRRRWPNLATRCATAPHLRTSDRGVEAPHVCRKMITSIARAPRPQRPYDSSQADSHPARHQTPTSVKQSNTALRCAAVPAGLHAGLHASTHRHPHSLTRQRMRAHNCRCHLSRQNEVLPGPPAVQHANVALHLTTMPPPS